MANRSLGLASLEASNAAARLASGVRSVSGKAGGSDIAYADAEKASSKATYAASAAAQWEVSQAQMASAILDSLAALYVRGAELEALSTDPTLDAELAANYLAELDGLVNAIGDGFTDALALIDTASLAGTEAIATVTSGFAEELVALAETRGTIAGIAAGKDYEAIGLAAAANAQVDAANNYIAVDFGAEAANLARNQVIQQAAAAMLAQANQMPNVVLALLK